MLMQTGIYRNMVTTMMLLINIAALLCTTSVASTSVQLLFPLPEPTTERVCDVKAWVRAEDLYPNAMANGDLRIKLKPSCTEKIASVALQLQLDEFSEFKYLRKGATLPTFPPSNATSGMPEDSDWNYHKYYEALQDPALWVVGAEERTAWKSFVTLVKEDFDYSRPLVVPFVVAVPNVNYPPGRNSPVNVFYSEDTPVTFNKHIYRYTAIISFESGRTTEVPAGYTTFRPKHAAPPPLRPFAMNVTFTEPICLGEKFSSSTNGTVFSGQIVLDSGNVVRIGDTVKGRITLDRLVSGSIAAQSVYIQLRSGQHNRWARAQAALGGDDAAFKPGSCFSENMGQGQIYASPRYASVFRDQSVCDYHGEPGGSSEYKGHFNKERLCVPFEIQVTEEMVQDFRAYYVTFESFLDMTLVLVEDSQRMSWLGYDMWEHHGDVGDVDLYEEGLWDSWTLIGDQQAVHYQVTKELYAKVPITILSTRAYELSNDYELPVHYLTPRVPSPLILATPPASPKDIVFPSSHPVIVPESVPNTTARMLTEFWVSGDVHTTRDYFFGIYAGLLWKKKIAAEDIDKTQDQDENQKFYRAP